MPRTLVRAVLVAVPALAACDLSAPVWSADFFFPVDFPDIALSDFAVAGQIPGTDVPFQTLPESQDITGLLEEFLSGEDLNALTAEIITETAVNITGNVTVTIAQDPADLFVAGRSITVQLPIAQGVDTTVVTVDPTVLRDAIALYYQSQGTLRGAPGGTPVSAADEIVVDVNLFANYRVSR